MSATIDERIVSMKFDNSEFEKNVKESMSTLDKLKEKLKLKDATTGLDELSSKANNLSLSHLSTVADNIGAKFSRLWDEILIGGMRRVGEQAVQTGERLLKAFTVDNISAGWSKFEEKTRSVGTLVSQGFDMSEVNEQLERLMWFTDETSYNFTDMVNNIGKFTASGAGLEESVTAMEGIATWAAMSGQNATTASRAMYQLSQAMSKGVMRLEDYKSIQNANMDTREFREQAVQAALACGQLKKVGADAFQTLTGKVYTLNELFSDGLTKSGWFDKETMMSVFNKYSSAVDAIYEYADAADVTASEAMATVDEIRNKASELGITTDEVIDKFYNGNEAIKQLTASADEFGLKSFRAAQEARTWSDVIDSVKDAVSSKWMQTFEIIFGQYDEAVELFTDLANRLYDIFAASGDARNEMLSLWKELGGRKMLVESFYNIVEALSKALGTVKEAFRNIFPAMTGHDLAYLTERFRDFTKQLIISDETAENLKNTFGGVFAIFRLAIDIVKEVISTIFPAVKGAGNLLEIILRGTGAIGKFIQAVVKLIESTRAISKVINLIKTAISAVIGVIVSLASKIADLTQKFFALEPVQAVLRGIVFVLESILKGVVLLVSAIIKLGSIVANFFASYGPTLLSKIGEGILKIKDYLVIAKNAVVNFFTSFTDRFDGIKSIFTFIKDSISNFFSGFNEDGSLSLIERLENAFNKLKESIQPAIDKIKEFAQTHIDPKKIGIVALIAVLSILTLAFVKLANAMTSIGNSVAQIGTFFSTLTKIFKKKYAKNFSDYALEISIAIAILTAAVAALAILGSDPKYDLGKALGTVAILSGIVLGLAVVFEILDKKMGGVKTAPLVLLGMASAIGILAASLFVLNEINLNGLFAKVGALAMLIVLLGGFGYFLSQAKGSVKSAITLIAFALSIRIVAKSLELLTKVDLAAIEDHLSELIVVISLLAVIGLAAGKVGIGSVVSLLGICLVLRTFGDELTQAAKTFNPDVVAEWFKKNWKMLTIAAGAFLAMTALTRIIAGDAFKNLGIGLIGVSAALLALTGVLIIIQNNFTDWNGITKGLVVLGALFGFIALLEAFSWRTRDNQMLKFAASLMVLTVVMTILSGLAVLIGGLANESNDIWKGLGFIAAMFVLVGALEGLSTLTEKAKFGPLVAFIAGIITIIGSLLILTSFFSNVEKVGPVILAFATVIGTIASIAIVMSRLNKMTTMSKNVFKTLIALIGGITLLMGSIILMAETVKDPIQLSLSILGCMGIMHALSELCDEISGDSGLGDSRTYLKKIATLLTITGAITALMYSLTFLKDMDWLSLTLAVASMGVVFTAMLVSLKIMSNITKSVKKNNIIAFGVMAAAIAGIMVSLSFLAKNDWTSIAASFGGLIGTLIALRFILKAVSTMTIATGNILKMAAGVAMLLGIAYSIKMLASYSWKQILPGVVSAIGVFAAMVGLFSLLNVLAAGGANAAGFGLAIAAIVAIAGAFALLSYSTTWLADSFERFQKSFTVILTTLNINFKAFIPELEKFSTIVITSFAQAIVLFQSFGDVLSNFVSTMQDLNMFEVALGITAIAGAGYLLGQAGTSMIAGVPGFIGMNQAISQFGTSIMSAATSISEAASIIVNTISTIVTSMGNILYNAGYVGIANFGLGALDGFKSVASACIDAVTNIGTLIVEAFYIALGEHSPSVFAENAATMFGAGFLNGLIAVSQPVMESMNELGENTVKSFNEPLENEQAATEGINQFGAYATQGTLTVGVGLVELWGKIGAWCCETFSDGLLSGVAEITGGLPKILKDKFNSIKSSVNGVYTSLFKPKTVGNFQSEKEYLAWLESSKKENDYLGNLYNKLKGYKDEALEGASEALEEFTGNLNENASALGGAGSAASQAKDQYASLKETIAGQIDIFSEFSKKTDLTADQLLKNMRSQVQGVAEWAVNMQTLAGKGVDQGLLMKLQEMGPQGFEYVNAFVNMTTEQLAEANTLWDAALALPDMAASMLVNANPIGANLVMGLNQGVDENKALTAEQMALYGQETLTQLMTALGEHSPSVETHQMGIYLVQGFINGILAYTPFALSTINSFANVVLAVLGARFAASNFVQFGSNIIEGIVEGINSNAGAISAAIDAICAEAVASFQLDLDINSPSKVFRRLASCIPEGVAQGITRGSHFVSESMDEMSSMTIEKMKSTVELISDAVNLNVDSEPVIRPVLDLSGIQNESKKLNSIMSYNKAIGANVTFERSKVANSNTDQVTPDQASTFNFTQNNYSPKALSRIDIYRQTKNQFATLKGMVNGI